MKYTKEEYADLYGIVRAAVVDAFFAEYRELVDKYVGFVDDDMLGSLADINPFTVVSKEPECSSINLYGTRRSKRMRLLTTEFGSIQDAIEADGYDSLWINGTKILDWVEGKGWFAAGDISCE